jgi:amidase
MDDICMLSASILAQRIRERELTSEDVVRAFLERIEDVNPRIRAVVQLTGDRALHEALEADLALARDEPTGPLHGVPFTAKDVFDTAGVQTVVGLTERVGCVPDQDAAVVSRMRAAGGILVGKTNVPPGGSGGATDNPVHGRTNNPYDLRRSPAGSSGGEAAIQAAGGSAVGLGSDSGGSIRVPAHACGVAGLKPTMGRVPSTGAFDHAGGMTDARTQIGLLSRFVEDLALAFPLIAGPDGHDAGVIPMPHGDPSEVSLEGLRVAWYPDDGDAPTTPATANAVRDAAEALSAAGSITTEACPDGIGPEVWDITTRWWGWDDLPGGETSRLLSDWDRFRSRMLAFMGRFDLIVTPAAAGPAHLPADYSRRIFHYTLPFSLTGQPCVVVRAGTSPEGLPIGVQIVARGWREDVALAAAMAIERRLGGWQPPPLEEED